MLINTGDRHNSIYSCATSNSISKQLVFTICFLSTPIARVTKIWYTLIGRKLQLITRTNSSISSNKETILTEWHTGRSIQLSKNETTNRCLRSSLQVYLLKKSSIGPLLSAYAEQNILDSNAKPNAKHTMHIQIRLQHKFNENRIFMNVCSAYFSTTARY